MTYGEISTQTFAYEETRLVTYTIITVSIAYIAYPIITVLESVLAFLDR